MEFLKRLLVILIVLSLASSAKAQINSAMQKAFSNSYSNESDKKYSATISDIMPYYAENSYETNLRMGWLYYLAKNYTSSQNYYARAVAVRPTSIEARFGYIKPLSLLGSWDKVLEQYSSILKIDPQNTQANYWAGVLVYNRKQYAQAANYFTKVVNLYPFDYDGNHMLGWAKLFSGKKAEAKLYFEKALLIKPGDSSSSDGLSRTR